MPKLEYTVVFNRFLVRSTKPYILKTQEEIDAFVEKHRSDVMTNFIEYRFDELEDAAAKFDALKKKLTFNYVKGTFHYLEIEEVFIWKHLKPDDPDADMMYIGQLDYAHSNLPTGEIRELSEAQERYALDAYKGAKPKFHKGKYGKKHDYYTCGKCGVTVKDIVDDFCWSCGTRILWDNPRCLTDYKEQD